MPGLRGEVRREERDTAQTHIVFGTDTFPLRDPRRFPLAILTNVFGGGMSSRLFQRVREELGLAYAIFAYKHFYQSSGQLGVYIGAQHGAADAAIEAIGVEYDRLAQEGLPDAELVDGKRQLKGQIMLSLESPAARMGRLAGFELHGDDYRPLDAMLAEIDAVTAADVRAVSAEFFPSARQTVVRLGPTDGNGERRGSMKAPLFSSPRSRSPFPSHYSRIRGPMLIGVPKEIKTNENRIALVPAGAEALTGAGHSVLIEQGAGLGSGFPDAAYDAVGATIVPTAEEVWQRAEMIMKVKEPIAVEWPRMRKGQVIYTYFHFAAAEDLTRAVIASGAIAVAYETVQLPSGELPLLTPMSEVAGRMAVQEGAKYLEKVFGGSGILLGGVPGVAPGEVAIIGGGVVGINSAKMAAGLGPT